MEIYIPGPMHPDLFDGETPIMVPGEFSLFDVDISWTVTEIFEETFTVAALNEEDAAQLARKAAEHHNEGDGFEVQSIEINVDDDISDEDRELALAFYKERAA